MSKYKGLNTSNMFYIYSSGHEPVNVELVKDKERNIIELAPAWKGFFCPKSKYKIQ